MANVMSVEKRNTILRHLVEGNSVRSTCRLMGTNIPTVLRQLEWAGKHCAALLENKLQGLRCRHLECNAVKHIVSGNHLAPIHLKMDRCPKLREAAIKSAAASWVTSASGRKSR